MPYYTVIIVLNHNISYTFASYLSKHTLEETSENQQCLRLIRQIKKMRFIQIKFIE